ARKGRKMPDPSQFFAPLGTIAVVLVIVLLFYALIVLIARTLHRFMPATTPPRDPALDALRTRLAQGEIDEAEFQRLRSILQSH
ncbi:MAG: SHOCT domain-containing protein, partial [Candidatus Limnocylindrales bacterium]|nr:SHOCT domain-containing protein [Candidatus Limnocylindrales bacterium]